ncbi:MAG TPA: hypothetical protein DEF63_00990 [Cyanobacteria bacterium UBA11440]|nr:hypothetical protein [Cyanobacteria bacterium UBA11440]
MKTPEIWQKFLKTYTAKVFACLIFTDIPLLIFWLFIALGKAIDHESGWILQIFFFFSLLISSNILCKLVILLPTILLEKYFIKPDYELITSTPRGQKLEQLSIILQVIFLIFSLIYLLCSIILYKMGIYKFEF